MESSNIRLNTLPFRDWSPENGLLTIAGGFLLTAVDRLCRNANAGHLVEEGRLYCPDR